MKQVILFLSCLVLLLSWIVWTQALVEEHGEIHNEVIQDSIYLGFPKSLAESSIVYVYVLEGREHIIDTILDTIWIDKSVARGSDLFIPLWIDTSYIYSNNEIATVETDKQTWFNFKKK